MSVQSKRWRRIRHELAKAQDFRCCYCKRRFGDNRTRLRATIEHVIPKMQGGSNRRENLKAACQHCNQHRGSQQNQARQTKRNQAAKDSNAVSLT